MSKDSDSSIVADDYYMMFRGAFEFNLYPFLPPGVADAIRTNHVICAPEDIERIAVNYFTQTIDICDISEFLLKTSPTNYSAEIKRLKNLIKDTKSDDSAKTDAYLLGQALALAKRTKSIIRIITDITQSYLSEELLQEKLKAPVKKTVDIINIVLNFPNRTNWAEYRFVHEEYVRSVERINFYYNAIQGFQDALFLKELERLTKYYPHSAYIVLDQIKAKVHQAYVRKTSGDWKKIGEGWKKTFHELANQKSYSERDLQFALELCEESDVLTRNNIKKELSKIVTPQ